MRPGQDSLPVSRGHTSEVWIVSGPLSLRALVLWAVIIFIAGFIHGRQMRSLTEAGTGQASGQSAAAVASPPTNSNIVPAPSTVPATSPARVTIRMLKFSPDKLEVKIGEEVEWANADLTPHTATSQETSELNSGAINAGAAWRHTFSKAGTFLYFCTFHPEMKGVVVVR